MYAPTDTSEKGFQKLIVDQLIEKHKYIESYSADFDHEFALNKGELFRFLENTQAELLAYV